VAPGIPRDVLLEVRAVPAVDVSGVHLEGLESLLTGRVAAGVQLELVERGAHQLDLDAGGGLLRLADPAEEAGADQRRQQAEDDDDDEQFDQREPPLIARTTKPT